MLFCTFLHDYDVKLPNFTLLMEDINNRRRNFLSLYKLGYGSWQSAPEDFACIWQSKRVGIIAIPFERTRIHFLSDVFVAWPSSTWYLKLPILLLMVATLVSWLFLVTYTRTYVHNPRDTRYILWTTLACEEDVPHDRSLGTKRSAPLPLDD